MGMLDSLLHMTPQVSPGCAWEYAHGEHCACLVLAAAVGAGPEAVSCDYCSNVLQKHWDVACDHGHSVARKSTARSACWQFGKLDRVKAMLVKEA